MGGPVFLTRKISRQAAQSKHTTSSAILPQYEQKNAVIVGVSVQNEDSHQKFCTKEGLSFKLLADTKQEVSSEYDSVYDSQRREVVRAPYLFDRSTRQSAKVWLEVKPDKHSEEVLAALASCKAPRRQSKRQFPF